LIDKTSILKIGYFENLLNFPYLHFLNKLNLPNVQMNVKSFFHLFILINLNPLIILGTFFNKTFYSKYFSYKDIRNHLVNNQNLLIQLAQELIIIVLIITITNLHHHHLHRLKLIF